MAALDSSAAQQVTQMAEEAWRLLAGPLVLPDSFSSPVYVRLVPGRATGTDAPFRVLVEPGGIVSVRLAWFEGLPPQLIRRALVQSLLLRLAVAAHGVNERLAAPLWLEQAGVGWWETRAEPAQLDALRQESRHLAFPPLQELLTWQRGDEESRGKIAGSVCLLTFLQSESGHTAAWTDFIKKLLGGEDPMAAVVATYGSQFSTREERELWWQTGGWQWRRWRVAPTLEAAESRRGISALARFVFAQGDADGALPLVSVTAHAQEPVVRAELAHRAAALGRLVSSLHPFYRNAGLSLAEALGSAPAPSERRAALCATFERDWRDAVEIEAATSAALEALEKRGAPLRPASVPPP